MASAEEPRRLERGMLLLDPETYSTPHLWTVVRVNKASAVVIAHYGACMAEANLRSACVPDGWTLVGHSVAVEALTAFGDLPDVPHPPTTPQSAPEPAAASAPQRKDGDPR